jgi:hypothetical protein
MPRPCTHLQCAVAAASHPLSVVDTGDCVLGHAGAAEHQVALLWNLPVPAMQMGLNIHSV